MTRSCLNCCVVGPAYIISVCRPSQYSTVKGTNCMFMHRALKLGTFLWALPMIVACLAGTAAAEETGHPWDVMADAGISDGRFSELRPVSHMRQDLHPCRIEQCRLVLLEGCHGQRVLDQLAIRAQGLLDRLPADREVLTDLGIREAALEAQVERLRDVHLRVSPTPD